MIRTIQRILLDAGVSFLRYPPPDLTSSRNGAILQKVTPYTKTSPERICAMCEAVRYVSSNGIPGDIVECGVWRGGSMMIAALVLLEMNDRSRGLHLFDTFEGMPPPGPLDVTADGASAVDLLSQESKADQESVWSRTPLEEVKGLLPRDGIRSGEDPLYQGAGGGHVAGARARIDLFAPAGYGLVRVDPS